MCTTEQTNVKIARLKVTTKLKAICKFLLKLKPELSGVGLF